MQYIPVLSGEVSGLRTGVESILDGNNQLAIAERIRELDTVTNQVGATATFGAEIEYTLIAEDGRCDTLDHDELYRELVHDLNGQPYDARNSYLPKGAVLLPSLSEDTVLVNQDGRANTDDQDFVSEVRTAPAQAQEAVNRYWLTLGAIGNLASRHGLGAMVYSTHISSGVEMAAQRADGDQRGIMMQYSTGSGLHHLAGTQGLLTAARPLQTGAGLNTGTYVSEAFPTSKDAATTVFRHRMEFRHDNIGVVDPRIDMLASLNGLQQTVTGSTPEAYLAAAYEAHSVDPNTGDVELDYFIRACLAYNSDKGLVPPSSIQPSAHGPKYMSDLHRFWKLATGKSEINLRELDARLPGLVADMRVSDGKIRIPYDRDASPALRIAMLGATASISKSWLPAVGAVQIAESPETYRQSRDMALQNPAVQHMLGRAASAVIPSAEADARRRALIEAHTIQR